MTTPKPDFSALLETVDPSHCSFCNRPYVDWETCAAGLKSDGSAATAGVCCIEHLKAVLAIHTIIPPTSVAIEGAITRLEAGLLGLQMGPPALSSSSISHVVRANNDRPLSPTAGSYTSTEIVAHVERVSRSDWSDEVRRLGHLAKKRRQKLWHYRWPDGIRVAFSSRRRPSKRRLIAGYRDAALALLNHGGNA